MVTKMKPRIKYIKQQQSALCPFVHHLTNQHKLFALQLFHEIKIATQYRALWIVNYLYCLLVPDNSSLIPALGEHFLQSVWQNYSNSPSEESKPVSKAHSP